MSNNSLLNDPLFYVNIVWLCSSGISSHHNLIPATIAMSEMLADKGQSSELAKQHCTVTRVLPHLLGILKIDGFLTGVVYQFLQSCGLVD